MAGKDTRICSANASEPRNAEHSAFGQRIKSPAMRQRLSVLARKRRLPYGRAFHIFAFYYFTKIPLPLAGLTSWSRGTGAFFCAGCDSEE